MAAVSVSWRRYQAVAWATWSYDRPDERAIATGPRLVAWAKMAA
jgi:hypothetical protein